MIHTNSVLLVNSTERKSMTTHLTLKNDVMKGDRYSTYEDLGEDDRGSSSDSPAHDYYKTSTLVSQRQSINELPTSFLSQS